MLAGSMKSLLNEICRIVPKHVGPMTVVETVACFLSDGYLPQEKFMRGDRTDREDMLPKLEKIGGLKEAGPEILGAIYETLLEMKSGRDIQAHRRKGGIFYTPRFIADYLVGLVPFLTWF